MTPSGASPPSLMRVRSSCCDMEAAEAKSAAPLVRAASCPGFSGRGAAASAQPAVDCQYAAQFAPGSERQAVERLGELLQWDWEWQMFDNPVFGTQCGHHQHDYRLQALSAASFELRAAHAGQLEQAVRAELAGGQLPAGPALHARVLVEDLACLQRNVANGLHLTLKLHGLGHGGTLNDLQEALEWTQLATPAQFEQLRRRLAGFPGQIADLIGLLKESLRRGFRPPTAVIEAVPGRIQSMLEHWPPELAEAIAQAPDERTRQALTDTLELGWRAGLAQLLEFVQGEYLSAATDQPGLCAQPNGKLLYRAYLRYNLGSDISAEKIHTKGLQEVARIRQRIEHEVFPALEHTGSIHQLGLDLRSRPDQQFGSEEQLVERFEQLLAKISSWLPKLFDKLPEAELQVRPLSTGGIPFYIAGTVDGSRPGITYLPTAPLDQQPAYEQPVYALHEGIPGHHLQNSLHLEDARLPNFLRILEERRYEWIPARRQEFMAYQEGWALYAEALGEEMGVPLTEGAVYDSVQSLFGRLSCEMSRAVRLVVDTGIHAFGWSIHKAARYMEEQTGMHPDVCERAMKRYASWPGQAVSYKLCILELRALAEQELGEKFDLKWFHSQVLADGPLPLDILEEKVKAAIAKAKATNP